MKLSEAVDKVSALARKVRAYYDRELPKWHPDYPIVAPGAADPPPPEGELRRLLETLPAETIHRLILLMHLGREDFGADELAGQYETVKQNYSEPEWAASYLLKTVPLAAYLSDALKELKQRRIPVDHLPLESTGRATA